MHKKTMWLLLVLLINSLEGMQKPSAKRRLFDSPERDRPAAAGLGSPGGYTTAPDVSATPELPKLRRLAERGIFKVSIHNMTNKPVIVTYFDQNKVQQGRYLPSYLKDFVKAQMEDMISFDIAPVIAPTGEDFLQLSLSNDKFNISRYNEGLRAFGQPIGSFPVKLGDIAIRLKSKIKDEVAQTTSTYLELVKN